MIFRWPLTAVQNCGHLVDSRGTAGDYDKSLTAYTISVTHFAVICKQYTVFMFVNVSSTKNDFHIMVHLT